MTPDNNLQRYYRALAAIAGEYRSAGASVVMAEVARYEGGLPDTLRASGLLLYESGDPRPQTLPLHGPAPGDWRYARMVDQARVLPERDPVLIAFQPVPSWYDGKEIHPALRAIARLRNEGDVHEPFPREGAIRYGSLRIPVTAAGDAYVPANGGARRTPAAMLFLKEGNDTVYAQEDWRPAFAGPPGSSAPWARGSVVLIRWVDTGGLTEWWRQARPSALAAIIDGLQRGRMIAPGGNWHLLLTGLLLLLGAALSFGKHLRIVAGALCAVALLLLAADAWLFASMAVLGNLLYPALGALLGGIFLPLSAHFHRHP